MTEKILKNINNIIHAKKHVDSVIGKTIKYLVIGASYDDNNDRNRWNNFYGNNNWIGISGNCEFNTYKCIIMNFNSVRYWEKCWVDMNFLQ